MVNGAWLMAQGWLGARAGPRGCRCVYYLFLACLKTARSIEMVLGFWFQGARAMYFLIPR